jgi:hypothetical protein
MLDKWKELLTIVCKTTDGKVPLTSRIALIVNQNNRYIIKEIPFPIRVRIMRN